MLLPEFSDPPSLSSRTPPSTPIATLAWLFTALRCQRLWRRTLFCCFAGA